ncbi:hypothetical protein Acor_13610 [Acrocarpospora corrugata]|uniref:Uncharacterized protein n=1 Tax=Acrocarpospora corrugata TaxID=35763 RepID=A0A5M3VY37_9ACTN|nr:hypothetical protein Acor_13610 [Acrocarpospora corrugata]
MAAPAIYRGAAVDGTRVWFSTTEAFPGTGDTDWAEDIYERRPDGKVRLISTGGRNIGTTFLRGHGGKGPVWFATHETIPGTGDTDTASDIYERTNGNVLRLVSPGSADEPAQFLGASVDGKRLWFGTAEAIPRTGDTDYAYDIYQRTTHRAITLVSLGVSDIPATFVGASADGSRVWFRTDEAIPGTGDTDLTRDIYEATAGRVRLITPGTANLDAHFVAASAVGARVWFRTREALPGTGDTDQSHDIYEAKSGAIRITVRN